MIRVKMRIEKGMAMKRTSVYNIAVGIASVILIAMIASTAFLLIQANSPTTSPPLLVTIRKPGCVIKGNISISNGTRYYHLPNIEDYDQTMISPQYGEQWFCTEAEAITHGWQKAPK
jgi:hypothetical protein